MRSALVPLLVVAGLAAPAAADTFTGEVISAEGRLTADRRWIVTEAVIRGPDGAEVTVLQPGGRAGGLAQRSWPAPPRLEPGMRVTVTARRGTDRRARPALVVEDVQVLDLPAGDAIPFVRTGPTRAGNYLRWASGCVFVAFDRGGTAHLAGDRELEILDETIGRWNDAVGGCAYLRLVPDGLVDDPRVGHDGRNVVVFRDDVWCRPPTEDLPEICLPPGAAGLTTVTYVDDARSSRDGEIVDADIELNGEEFAISDAGQSLGGAPCLADLANTFTHELGHLMGLDHTCRAPADPAKVDGRGEPVPLCTQTADPAITEATMYTYQECGETKKATPEPDDVAGVCAVYRVADDPGVCARPGDTGGCCSAGGGGAGGAALLTALLAAAAGRRRRSA